MKSSAVDTQDRCIVRGRVVGEGRIRNGFVFGVALFLTSIHFMLKQIWWEELG